MRLRKGSDGLHIFDRESGINVLLDEISVPRENWSRAPRFVSFALTNACDLNCPFCYAPKLPASLSVDNVVGWSVELSDNGCLGIGFGGGEPTIYPRFAELCQTISRSTRLAVGFTTHAHRFTTRLRDDLLGSVHFIRVSMDGVGKTYERLRNRSFSDLRDQLRVIADTSHFGINFVVNDTTVGELDEAADVAFSAGATEFLLLPEVSDHGLRQETRDVMTRWTAANADRVRLSISELGVTSGIPLADPFTSERGTRAYVHVGADGSVSRTSYYRDDAVDIKTHSEILAAIKILEGDSA